MGVKLGAQREELAHSPPLLLSSPIDVDDVALVIYTD